MRYLLALCLVWLFGIGAASAQPIIGQCQVPGATYLVHANLYVQQAYNPANNGFAMRDPSGMTYVMLPSTSPALAFFIEWNGALTQVSWQGKQQVGVCSIAVPPPPITVQPGPHTSYGVEVPGGLAALPAPIVNPNQPFGLPLIAATDDAVRCADESDPQTCLVREMLGKRERAVYDCSLENQSQPALQAACVVGALGGDKEKKIAGDFASCFDESGGSYEVFSLCMAGQQFDGDMATLVRCVSRQPPGQTSVMATAVCYGATKLDLNPEAQIVIQCAVASGGEPEVFAGCAGGELTRMELQKCQTNGFGGDNGCFGPNNDIVKYLKNGGLQLQQIYGPGNALVKAWNDGTARIIAGAREQGVQLLRNAAVAVVKSAPTLAKEGTKVVKRVLPRITVGNPSVTIGGKRFSW